MNYNNPSSIRTARVIAIVCGSLFCIFSYFYIWKVQGGILGMAQHVLSNGLTVYFPPVGAGIITVLLLFLQMLLNRIFKLQREWHCISYYPSFFTLAMISSVASTAYTHFQFGYWIWLYPVGLVAFMFVVSFFKHLSTTFDVRAGGVIIRTLIPNLIIFIILAIICMWLSDTNEVAHDQYAIEYNLSKRDVDSALEVGNKSKATNPEITALRIYSLQKKDLLGEKLFMYPQEYGADGMLLNLADSVRMIFPPMQLYKELGAYPRFANESAVEFLELLNKSEQARQPMAEQYLLCAYLLDRDLDKFVDKLRVVYHFNEDSVIKLPRYYQEALVLYQHNHPGKINYKNSIQEANYEDYRRMVKSSAISQVSKNKSKVDFGNTYWWYYDTVK